MTLPIRKYCWYSYANPLPVTLDEFSTRPELRVTGKVTVEVPHVFVAIINDFVSCAAREGDTDRRGLSLADRRVTTDLADSCAGSNRVADLAVGIHGQSSSRIAAERVTIGEGKVLSCRESA